MLAPPQTGPAVALLTGRTKATCITSQHLRRDEAHEATADSQDTSPQRHFAICSPGRAGQAGWDSHPGTNVRRPREGRTEDALSDSAKNAHL